MMAYDTNLDVFSWLRSLGYGAHFNDHMAGYRHGRTPWMVPSVYPVEARLVKGADTSCDAPFLVDIGGNRGHDLEEFHKYHPSTPGRLYLQDTEIVIHSIESLPDAITSMPYDFFTEQPIKGNQRHRITMTESVVITNLVNNRRPCLLHTLLPARLAGRQMQDDSFAHPRRYETRL
jgi:hypothetical protein